MIEKINMFKLTIEKKKYIQCLSCCTSENGIVEVTGLHCQDIVCHLMKDSTNIHRQINDKEF